MHFALNFQWSAKVALPFVNEYCNKKAYCMLLWLLLTRTAAKLLWLGSEQHGNRTTRATAIKSHVPDNNKLNPYRTWRPLLVKCGASNDVAELYHKQLMMWSPNLVPYLSTTCSTPCHALWPYTHLMQYYFSPFAVIKSSQTNCLWLVFPHTHSKHSHSDHIMTYKERSLHLHNCTLHTHLMIIVKAVHTRTVWCCYDTLKCKDIIMILEAD